MSEIHLISGSVIAFIILVVSAVDLYNEVRHSE